MLRGKIFEINEEIKVGGQICPPPGMNRVNVLVVNKYDLVSAFDNFVFIKLYF